MQEDTVLVIFHTLPFVNLGNETTICTTSSVTLDAGAGFTSYLWTDGSTNQTFTLNGSAGAGVYTVTVMVTDSFGCPGSGVLIITVNLCTGIEYASPALSIPFSIYPDPPGFSIEARKFDWRKF